MARPSPESRPSAAGTLLRYWRRQRRLSQLALATEAAISPRHLCFLETGRSKPSRDMLLHLAAALDVPLRERNTLLLAAGFAPVYRELDLDAADLAPARSALNAILQHQEPHPAVVMNRHWDLLLANEAATRFFRFLLGQPPRDDPINVLRMMFAPDGLRPYIVNWAEVAERLIRRVHREAVGGVVDTKTVALLRTVLAYPGVPARWQRLDLDRPVQPMIPISFAKAQRSFNYFSTVTTLGTPQDITLQEIRLECFFPTDEETTRNALQLAVPVAQSQP